MAEAKEGQWKFIGPHADTLANGRPVGPGEVLDLSQEEVDANTSMIEQGHLLDMGQAERDVKATTSRSKEKEE